MFCFSLKSIWQKAKQVGTEKAVLEGIDISYVSEVNLSLYCIRH